MYNGLNPFSQYLNELGGYYIATKDLRNAFHGISEPIYYDLNHMSDFGNKIIAQNLYNLPLPFVLEP